MNEPNELPEISEGARELLRITLENDRHKAIARNAALLAVLDWLERLHAASDDPSPGGLSALFRKRSTPKTFIELTCATLACVQEQLDRLYEAPTKSAEPIVTDFNRHAFQALAETLADATWPERSAKDFDGPSVNEIAKRLFAKKIPELQQSLVRNYLGNILQDSFAAARIRERVPDLDPATEMNLRSQDSESIATFVMQAAKKKAEDHPGLKLVVAELKAAIEGICK